ncbi:hypothetical protein PENSPDRAFT_647633 [Peniophora sp. CONT]|nr:hypothetical protein PENSPDRAFT_647633 [Peniophora sp. CONT]
MSPTLPPELWVHVFGFVNSGPEARADYIPFEAGILSDDVGKRVKANLRDRLSLISVCKLWYRLGKPTLYHDVIVRGESSALADVLSAKSTGDSDLPFGGCVRSLELPFIQTTTSNAGPYTSETILGSCAHLERLTRPPSSSTEVFGLQFEFPMPITQLPALRRLDWWHNNFAYRTGGINALPDVLKVAPNLKYLSLGGEMLPNTAMPAPLSLPHLQTLRVRGINPIYVRQLRNWDAPALRTIILESLTHPYTFPLLWDTIPANQIENVELGAHLHFLARDYIALVISGCSNLRELSYRIFFAAEPKWGDAEPHKHLTRVRWQAFANQTMPVESVWYWIWIHANAFMNRTLFPTLEEIVLHGEEWSTLGNELEPAAVDEMKRLKKELNEKGITLTVQ